MRNAAQGAQLSQRMAGSTAATLAKTRAFAASAGGAALKAGASGAAAGRLGYELSKHSGDGSLQTAAKTAGCITRGAFHPTVKSAMGSAKRSMGAIRKTTMEARQAGVESMTHKAARSMPTEADLSATQTAFPNAPEWALPGLAKLVAK